jgi:hypothetical protein
MDTESVHALHNKLVNELSRAHPKLPAEADTVPPALQALLDRLGLSVQLGMTAPLSAEDKCYDCDGIQWDGTTIYPCGEWTHPWLVTIHEIGHNRVCNYFDPLRLTERNYGLGHVGGCGNACKLRLVGKEQSHIEERMTLIVAWAISYTLCRDGGLPHNYWVAIAECDADKFDEVAIRLVLKSGLVTVDAAGEPQLGF